MSLKKRFALFTLAFLLSLAGALGLMDRQLDKVKNSRRSIREDQEEVASLFEALRLLAAMRDHIALAAREGAAWPLQVEAPLREYGKLLEDLRESSADDDDEIADEGERLEAQAVEQMETNARAWMTLAAERRAADRLQAEDLQRAEALLREGDQAATLFLQGAMKELSEALESLEAGEERANRLIFEWSALLLCFWAAAWLALGYGLLAPVERLRGLARRLQERDFKAADSVKATGSGEVAELTAAFVEMAAELREFTETLEKRVAERTRELEASRHRLSEMLNHLPDCVALADTEGRIQSANAPWKRLFDGREAKEFRNILASPSDATGARHWIDAEGRERILEISRFSLDEANSQNDKRLWLKHIRDVTRQRDVEAALASSQKLAAIGRLSAGIAHEINNPLASIGACAEGLAKRLDKDPDALAAESETFRDYLATIREEVARCKDITEKLLDHSRQRRQEKPEEFDAAEVAAGVVKLVESLASRKGVAIAWETQGEARLLGDARALKQICLNLALNALEACSQGGKIVMAVRASKSSVLLEVRDDGVGIGRGDLEHLFEPFFTKRAGGTGLGLFVCQGMAEAMGGSLSAASEGEGKGSVFTLCLPRRQTKPAAEISANATRL